MIKTRVYEVAREMGLDNRELMTKLATLGVQVRNHMSSLEVVDIERVKRAVEKEKQHNVVEERIRPTVVRRRAVVKREDDEAPTETAAAAPAPAHQAKDEPRRPAAPSPVVAAPAPARREPASVVRNIEPVAHEAPTPSAKPRGEMLPPPPPVPIIVHPQVDADARKLPSEPVATEPPVREQQMERPRRGGPLPFDQRLPTSDLPPGVVARGSMVGGTAAPLSAAARARIISEHQAKTAQLQQVAAGGATPPRRRELARSALGPTGRQQQQRGRPGRARKMAPGKKGAKTEITTPSAAKRVIRIEDDIGLQVLAARMSLKATDVLAKLMELGTTGVMINSTLDADTANILAAEFGFEVENVAVTEDDLITEARGEYTDDAASRESRPPVVTVMGHVDHGKTSLLDRIRRTNVASQESGGITQHIGAYHVETKKGTIVFIDTPGHAAFTAMRSRGANATDLVILVVAADDGVMPQTKEAIAHAKAANVPIIVAINKMDKPDARPDVIMRDLASEGLQSEEWGGQTIFAKVSAQTGIGIDELLDSVLLQAEVLELKTNPSVPAEGVVLEAYLDKGRGPVANFLVQDGTLSTGNFVVAGSAFGKIRAMTDDSGKPVVKVGASTPVEVLGLSEVPEAGDHFNIVTDVKVAQQIAERRRKVSGKSTVSIGAKVGLDAIYQKMQEGEVQELKLVVKADVQGSAEALVKALSELSTDKVKVVVVHSGAGGISESDVMLASASRGIVIGFHVRPSGGATKIAKSEKVEIRTYSIIYEVVDDVKKAMIGLLKPVYKESPLGRAEVRAVFTLPKGVIAGSFVTDGKLVRGAKARLMRGSEQVWEGTIRSLRRIKEDVKEVNNGLECGIGLEYADIKELDIIECFEMQEMTAQL
jgi:translation initiation factor IF-2